MPIKTYLSIYYKQELVTKTSYVTQFVYFSPRLNFLNSMRMPLFLFYPIASILHFIEFAYFFLNLVASQPSFIEVPIKVAMHLFMFILPYLASFLFFGIWAFRVWHTALYVPRIASSLERTPSLWNTGFIPTPLVNDLPSFIISFTFAILFFSTFFISYVTCLPLPPLVFVSLKSYLILFTISINNRCS